MAGRWGEGIWLGIRDESGEAIIGTEDGVHRARTVRRKASNHERWNRSKLDAVRTTPWNATDNTRRDEDIKVQIPGQEEELKEVPKAEESEIHQRRFHIRVQDVRKEGETPDTRMLRLQSGHGPRRGEAA